MNNAVELDNVSKRYLLGEDYGPGRTLREAVTSSLRRRHRRNREELWSLRDVTFSVEQGEALGVIGHNGAGKSTLLKVLTRITEPTSGVARMRGRVGALLEVGAGFHWELTGRENIYLNGAILGMGRREIDAQFDAIVAFAGVERFLDTPVKRFSSGMYLRLAFAIAAHLQAEILLVDEVLAVGDLEFQQKCFAKMEQVCSDGRTVMFVSHNLDSIARLCPRAVWLERGRIRAIGRTEEIIEEYVGSAFERGSEVSFPPRLDTVVALRSVGLSDRTGHKTVVLRRDEPFVVELRFDVREPVAELDATVCIDSIRGARVLDEAWSDGDDGPRGAPGEYVVHVEIPPILNPGDYSVSVFIGTDDETFVWEDRVLQFRLEGDMRGRPDRLLQLMLPWKVSRSPLHLTREH